MAVVGAVKDGLTGDTSMLAKLILDMVIVLVLTVQKERALIFAWILVVTSGLITLLAQLIAPRP